MQISIKLVVAIGIILGCATLGFTMGHAVGKILGREITSYIEIQQQDIRRHPLTP